MTPAPLVAALSDRYRIQRELGASGMATVYLAEDLKHRRQVVIKVLHQDIANTIGPERFLREIEIAARLHHPHILPLYDSGEAGGFLGDEYFHQGALLGVDDAMLRAESALERAVALDSSVSGPVEHLLLSAALQGDTGKLRRRLALNERTADSIAYARHAWMTGALLGDRAAASRALETMVRTADDNRVLLGGPQILLPCVRAKWIGRSRPTPGISHSDPIRSPRLLRKSHRYDRTSSA